MKKWAMIVDVAKCENCNNCFLSCKDEHVGNDFPGYAASQPEHGHRWIDIIRKERGQAPVVDYASMPVMCNHCDDAPCIKAAKNKSVYKREDGIVIIDPEKAHGQRDLVKACPYGAIWWNEEKQLPQKWIFDAHLLDSGWKEPRCVQSCPTGALHAVKLEDAQLLDLISKEELEARNPEFSTRPRVLYKNLYLMTKCFIAGSVAAQLCGIQECLEAVSISLIQGQQTLLQTVTDNYGEFSFDKLEPNSGLYQLKVEKQGMISQVIELELVESAYIGLIQLEHEDSCSQSNKVDESTVA